MKQRKVFSNPCHSCHPRDQCNFEIREHQHWKGPSIKSVNGEGLFSLNRCTFLGPSGQNELGFTSTQSKIFDSSHSSWFDGRSYFLPKWLLLLNFYPIEVKTCADDLSSDSESGKIGFIACAPFFSSTWASARCTWLAPEQVLRSPCFPPFSVAAPLVWPGFPTDWATWLSGAWHLASQRQKSHRNPLVNRTLALVGEEANCSWCSCCFSFFFQTAHTKFLFSCCQSNLFLWPLNRVAIPHVMMKPRPPCAKRGTGSMGKIRSKVQTTFFVCTCKRWLADVFRALQELLMLSHVTLSLSRPSECWAN